MSKKEAKKYVGLIKLYVNAGQAKPAPPVGPALGQAGLNLMQVCKDFNAKTADIRVRGFIQHIRVVNLWAAQAYCSVLFHRFIELLNPSPLHRTPYMNAGRRSHASQDQTLQRQELRNGESQLDRLPHICCATPSTQPFLSFLFSFSAPPHPSRKFSIPRRSGMSSGVRASRAVPRTRTRRRGRSH